MDSNDTKLFQSTEEGTYTLERSGTGKTLPLEYLSSGQYEYAFNLATIEPDESLTVRYKLTARSIAFGRITVGLLEKGEVGDDIYGDIAMSPNNMCGGSVTIWRSVDPAPRSYQKGIKNFEDTSKLPEELEQNTIDKDKNGVPDYIDALTKSAKSSDTSLLQDYASGKLADYNKDLNNNGIPDKDDTKGNTTVQYDPVNQQVGSS